MRMLILDDQFLFYMCVFRHFHPGCKQEHVYRDPVVSIQNTLLITTRMRMFISCALLSKYVIVGDSQLQNGNQIYRCHGTDITPRADYRFAPSQWERSLQSNAVCHWLGANLESALTPKQSRFFTHFFLCTRLISIRGCKSSIPVPYHLHRATVLAARITTVKPLV